jgi:hypothetical protein
MKCVSELSAVLLAFTLGCGGRLLDDSGGQRATIRGGSSNGGGAGSSSSGNASSGGTIPGQSGGSASPDGGAGVEPVCGLGTNWQCAVDTTCSSSSRTTLKGRVFDPAGTNPLQGVAVFIPNDAATLPVVVRGTSTCRQLAIGDYVTIAVTDATGSFTLNDVPTGIGVPITVQLGKWRRTTTVNVPTPCATTTVPDGVLRLPKNHKEGDMPQMALLTGGCDDFGCFMTNIGIDPAEFGAPHNGGAVDVYQGLGVGGSGASLSNGTAGDCTNASCPLWASKQSLEFYDMAILSCECGENTQTKPAAAMQALHDWLDEGGSVLASHFQYTWFKNSPSADFQNVATWLGDSVAVGSGMYDVNTSFRLGKVFGDWLDGVGALDTSGASSTIALQNVASSVSSVSALVNQWIYDTSTRPTETKALSFETPVGGNLLPPAPEERTYCGGVAFTDLHTTGGSTDMVSAIPSGCTPARLTPQQAVEEFLFFNVLGWAPQPVQVVSPPGP